MVVPAAGQRLPPGAPRPTPLSVLDAISEPAFVIPLECKSCNATGIRIDFRPERQSLPSDLIVRFTVPCSDAPPDLVRASTDALTAATVPITLDLQSIVSGDAGSTGIGSGSGSGGGGSCLYELYAATVYYGSGAAGHYIAHAQRGGSWYEFNDSYCHKLSGPQFHTVQPTQLFYRRVPTAAAAIAADGDDVDSSDS